MTSRKPSPDQLGLLLSQEPTTKRARHILCGVDEAGRRPLTGPVTVTAVVPNPRKPIKGLADSKILTARKQEALYNEIVERTLA